MVTFLFHPCCAPKKSCAMPCAHTQYFTLNFQTFRTSTQSFPGDSCAFPFSEKESTQRGRPARFSGAELRSRGTIDHEIYKKDIFNSIQCVSDGSWVLSRGCCARIRVHRQNDFRPQAKESSAGKRIVQKEGTSLLWNRLLSCLNSNDKISLGENILKMSVSTGKKSASTGKKNIFAGLQAVQFLGFIGL